MVIKHCSSFAFKLRVCVDMHVVAPLCLDTYWYEPGLTLIYESCLTLVPRHSDHELLKPSQLETCQVNLEEKEEEKEEFVKNPVVKNHNLNC
jgi:hypothetical protein